MFDLRASPQHLFTIKKMTKSEMWSVEGVHKKKGRRSTPAEKTLVTSSHLLVCVEHIKTSEKHPPPPAAQCKVKNFMYSYDLTCVIYIQSLSRDHYSHIGISMCLYASYYNNILF